jgi:hypothetical protein
MSIRNISPRTVMVCAIAVLLGATALATPASARWDDQRAREERGRFDRNDRGDHHYSGGYYRAPPVYYSQPYYAPPPIVFGVPGVNVFVR